MSLKEQVNVFDAFLPKEVVHGQPTVKTILENTRHTPRDLIQAMRRIAEMSRGPIATEREVLAALRNYSVDYMIREIKDELCGLVPQEEAERSLQLLSMCGFPKLWPRLSRNY